MKIIVSGGGTGGHIYPAISIADRFKEEYPDSQILYVGVRNGLESRIAAQYGYEFRGLEVKGFQRKISLENVKRVILAAKAMKEASEIMREFRPDIVIGTGGYVCGPVVMAASRAGAVTAVHEQNAFPGITNKILAKKADRVFLGFEAARQRMKCKNDPITVGNPVRKDIRMPLERSAARKKLGISDETAFILVTGGSGGFGAINDAFIKIIPDLIQRNVEFAFSTGRYYYEPVIKTLKDMGIKTDFRVFEYIDSMPDYLSASDLCIVSAGATTLAEINAVGRPSIIVPKAYTSENHQEYNARYIKSMEAGEYILEKELSGELLYEKIMDMIENPEKRKIMEENSRKLNDGDPCEAIIKELSQLIKVK